MKRPLILALVCSLPLFGCSNEPEAVNSASTDSIQAEMPEQAPNAEAPLAAAVSGLGGTVLETMDSGGYTYVLIDTGAESVWAAGPQTEVAVGDAVSVVDPMPMPDFHSGTLGRDFDMIYFSSGISGAKAHAASVDAAAETAGGVAAVEKAADGQTIAEIFAASAELSGNEVVLRGKVVKFSAQIMGKNWLHIRDGSGSEGSNDLTVTTDTTVAVGDTVLVRGVLATDKDFGYGYLYDVIVEDAQVTVE